MSKALQLTALLAGLAISQPVFAGDCPPVPDFATEKDQLYSDLPATKNEMLGRAVGDQLWIIWTTAPNVVSQELLDKGRERIRVADYERAEEYFTALINYCPHYAEGWNQRAFTHFLRQNYAASLDDIDAALEREPRHFGALAGRATTLISMGRTEVGHKALREALKVNPWLSERHLLPPGNDI